MTKDQQRFDELCFLYACGKADPADAAWLEQMLIQHPAWQATLDTERTLVDAGRSAQSARRAAQAPLLSDAEFMALAERANAEHDATVPTPKPAPSPAGVHLLDALRAWWQRPLQGGYAYGAMAMLALLASVQTYRLQQMPDASQYRSATVNQSTSAQLRVQFDDRISAGELRAALSTLGLSIVHGPDHSGAYLLAVSGNPAQAAQQLQARHLVLDVQLLAPDSQGTPP